MSGSLTRLRALPIWNGKIEIEPLKGGLSNESFKVMDGGKGYVVRFGNDFPFHHVSRAREAMTTEAAASCGLAPSLVHAEPGVMVIDYIDGKTLEASDVVKEMPRITDLVRRYHRAMPRAVRGAAFMFWPFHVIRDYTHTLKEKGSRKAGDIPAYLTLAEELEQAQMPLPIIFGHHDLLPGNLIDDGQRLWLIDFEYGGFSTPMFDLANLASNAGFDADQSERLLALYFGQKPGADLLRSHAAMQCVSLLREAMWSMVSELCLNAPGADYEAYTEEYLERLAVGLDSYRSRFGKG
jgi:thiamine kinase-like enzyme